jgi:hypothetical protein
VRAGRALTVGAGAWYNRVAPFVGYFPDFGPLEVNARWSYYGFYGNVFYRYFGVQAGLIPVRRRSGARARPG